MFEEAAIIKTNQNWDDAQEINKNITKLNTLLVDEIRVEGDLEKSKLAWKVAILTQSILHRISELAITCCANWNSNHQVSSIVLARALIETGAMLYDFSEKVEQYTAAKDLDSLDKLVMNRTFSARSDQLISDKIDNKAINILSIIQKMNKVIPGFEDVYNRMSEVAHPNQMGHFQAYGDLDRSDGTVRFGTKKLTDASFSSIMCALSMVELSYEISGQLQKNVSEISSIQHEINPVK